MKNKLLGILFTVAFFAFAANAQNNFDGRSLAGIKQDFKAVGAVARVKIKNIKLAAEDVHPLYAVESELVEIFKGKIKKQKTLTFYFHAEADYDAQKLIGKDYVVFLEKERAVPAGGKAWYELENSKISTSEKLIAQLRKMKSSSKKG